MLQGLRRIVIESLTYGSPVLKTWPSPFSPRTTYSLVALKRVRTGETMFSLHRGKGRDGLEDRAGGIGHLGNAVEAGVVRLFAVRVE